MAKRIYIVICMLLILLFSYTAFAKLINIPLFTSEMHNQPMPLWFSSVLVYLLPVLEILIVIALLMDHYRLLGMMAALFLMLLFTAYTLLILLHVFPRVPCSCGGVIKQLSWKQHLAFNLVFDGLCIWGLFLHDRLSNNKIIHE